MPTFSAYACRIIPEHYGVIASENPEFDKDVLLAWVEEYGTGYFIRDESNSLDCSYMTEEVFLSLYMFESGDTDAMFRKILQLK